MGQHAAQAWWLDQFLLRREAAGGALAPFPQAIGAAEALVGVALDRVDLPRPSYEAVGTLRYQAQLLADFARNLEAELGEHARRAEEAVAERVVTEAEASRRARTMMGALSGALQSVASLTEVCHALVVVAEGLLVITRPRSRVALVSAVEAVRGAASTSLVIVSSNIGRVTDAVLYDRLEAVSRTVDATLVRADQVSEVIRAGSARPELPVQRVGGPSPWGAMPG